MALIATVCDRRSIRHSQQLILLLPFFSIWLALVLALARPAPAAPMLFVDVGGAGANGTVEVGAMVVVTVLASDIPLGSDGDGMFGFGFDIGYDMTLLSAATPVLGPLWDGTGFSFSKNDPGDVGATSNRFFAGPGPISGDDILLATITFTGLSAGTATLTVNHFTGIGDNTLYDGTILDTDLSFFVGGSIEVTDPIIPEPATGGLVSLGLIGFAVGRRRLRPVASRP